MAFLLTCVARGQEEVMHTSWGQPLSMNPVNAIVYNPDDYSDESEDAQEAFEKKRFVFQCTDVQRVV